MHQPPARAVRVAIAVLQSKPRVEIGRHGVPKTASSYVLKKLDNLDNLDNAFHFKHMDAAQLSNLSDIRFPEAIAVIGYWTLATLNERVQYPPHRQSCKNRSA